MRGHAGDHTEQKKLYFHLLVIFLLMFSKFKLSFLKLGFIFLFLYLIAYEMSGII